jgi:hypothetical protein
MKSHLFMIIFPLYDYHPRNPNIPINNPNMVMISIFTSYWMIITVSQYSYHPRNIPITIPHPVL